MSAQWIPPQAGDPATFIEQATTHGRTDWHLAAALAWEHIAAELAHGTAGTGDTGEGVASASTGSQSVSYRDNWGGSELGAALRRAAWHRSRAAAYSTRMLGNPLHLGTGPWHELEPSTDLAGATPTGQPRHTSTDDTPLQDNPDTGDTTHKEPATTGIRTAHPTTRWDTTHPPTTRWDAP